MATAGSSTAGNPFPMAHCRGCSSTQPVGTGMGEEGFPALPRQSQASSGHGTASSLVWGHSHALWMAAGIPDPLMEADSAERAAQRPWRGLEASAGDHSLAAGNTSEMLVDDNGTLASNAYGEDQQTHARAELAEARRHAGLTGRELDGALATAGHSGNTNHPLIGTSANGPGHTQEDTREVEMAGSS